MNRMNLGTAAALVGGTEYGKDCWVFGFGDERSANDHAARRIASGRAAVAVRDGEIWACVYGAAGSASVQA